MNISDTLLLAAQMIERKITPSVISRGNAIMSLSLDKLNISFGDTFLYIKTSLAKCCKLYDISMLKGTFPLSANNPDYYEARTIPPFKYFINEGDSKIIIEEKKAWYQNKKRAKRWIFKDEISIKSLKIKLYNRYLLVFYFRILLLGRFVDIMQGCTEILLRMVPLASRILPIFP